MKPGLTAMIDHLKNPETFGIDNPFPTLAADEPLFDEKGAGCRGSVYPSFNFIIIKGLEKYAQYELARECAIRHLYYMLDTLHPEKQKGNIYEAYLPLKDGPAQWPEMKRFQDPLSALRGPGQHYPHH